MNGRNLPRSFFARDTHIVARALLGKKLVRHIGRTVVGGRITEVESYAGVDDLASHAARGRTARTEIMFGPAGYAYIYLVYGIHYCFNITTEEKEFPAAILVRALEPVDGIVYMQRARGTNTLHALTTGPGKLTQALSITSALNQEDLAHSRRIYIVDDGYVIAPRDIVTTTRIGVGYAGKSATRPWRYYVKASPYISKP